MEKYGSAGQNWVEAAIQSSGRLKSNLPEPQASSREFESNVFVHDFWNRVWAASELTVGEGLLKESTWCAKCLWVHQCCLGVSSYVLEISKGGDVSIWLKKKVGYWEWPFPIMNYGFIDLSACAVLSCRRECLWFPSGEPVGHTEATSASFQLHALVWNSDLRAPRCGAFQGESVLIRRQE